MMTLTNWGTTSSRSGQRVDEFIRQLSATADDLDALADELGPAAPAGVTERLAAHAETARRTASSIDDMVHSNVSAPSTDYFLG